MRYVNRLRTPFVLALLILPACGPRNGDVYEDLHTGDRYTVSEIGDCSDLRARASLAGGRVHFQSFRGEGECVMLGKADDLTADRFLASLEDLRQRFRRL